MAEEFENYEARLAEARRAVERWEADKGDQDAAEGTSEHRIPGQPNQTRPAAHVPKQAHTAAELREAWRVEEIETGKEGA